jgi:phosphoribosylformylglycinamidine cyclo-ligase
MYRVFNMGIGYTLIVRPAFADTVCAKLARMGETAMVIGEIVKGSGAVQI